MAKKSGFHVVCPNLFLFDSPCLLWFLKMWCYIIVPWWLMMLLVWLIMDSGHLEISICILLMKACCSFETLLYAVVCLLYEHYQYHASVLCAWLMIMKLNMNALLLFMMKVWRYLIHKFCCGFQTYAMPGDPTWFVWCVCLKVAWTFLLTMLSEFMLMLVIPWCLSLLFSCFRAAKRISWLCLFVVG